VRLTPDGETLVVAGMTEGSLLLVSTSTGEVETFALPSPAVQTAVLSDGSAAFATLYDTRQVARVELGSRKLELWDLPDAAGPVQLFPTPDDAHLWVADQGGLGSDPFGTQLFRLDARSGEVDLVAHVGGGPHGVVVSPDGARVWTTLLQAGAVASVDGETGELLTMTPVGQSPNGITLATPVGGG
jgi:DNA-binding beta-propeller fold protein YncE